MRLKFESLKRSTLCFFHILVLGAVMVPLSRYADVLDLPSYPIPTIPLAEIRSRSFGPAHCLLSSLDFRHLIR